ncbi:hypothetical protein [Methanococcoides burtonii]|nr:hypothetical protein [Methanococcoides burtonii]
MSYSKIEKISHLIGELERAFKEFSDEDFDDIKLFEEMDSLFVSILDPSNVSTHPNIAEFLLTNKHRSQFLAHIRYVITHNYSFKGSKNGHEAFVSPNHIQWYDDGVMFLEGKEPFLGFIGLYRNKEARYAIAARDAKDGEELSKPFAYQYHHHR